MKKLLFVVLFLGLFIPAITNTPVFASVGEQFTEGSLTFTVLTESGTDNTVSVRSGNMQMSGSLQIPQTVAHNGVTYTVTKISDYAFCIRTGLTGDLVIPDSITSIGEDAFYLCTGFTGDLVIPDSITSIGKEAFYSCTGFNGKLVLGANLTEIGANAFYQCKNLTGDLIIPDKVTVLNDSCFIDCTGFNGKLVLGSSLNEIGAYAFKGCTGLKGDLHLPSSVKTIREHAFFWCSGFDGTLSLGNVSFIGTEAFGYCTGFTGELVIPESLTSIGEFAFRTCSKLDSLTLPKNLQTIGASAFLHCSNLKGALVIGPNVSSIGRFAFTLCGNLSAAYFEGTTQPTVAANCFENMGSTFRIYYNRAAEWVPLGYSDQAYGTLKSVTADGSYGTATTHNLTVTFSDSMPSVSAADFVLEGATLDSINIGTLSENETTYTLEITLDDTIKDGDTLGVTVRAAHALVRVTPQVFLQNYSVGITGGSAGGTKFYKGDTVTAVADSVLGKTFTGWTTMDLQLTEAQKTSKELTFTMPEYDVLLTANFQINRHDLTVNNGSGSAAQVAYGSTVSVTANEIPGGIFTGWTTTGLTLTDAQKTQKELSFTMPDSAVVLTANTVAQMTEKYTVTQGAGQLVVGNGESTAVFNCAADFGGFIKAQIDGMDIAPGGYTVTGEAGTVTLQPSFLSTLSSGVHTLTFLYADGYARTDFTVKDAADTQGVATGDSAQQWPGLLVTAVCALAATAVVQCKAFKAKKGRKLEK